MSHTAVLHYVPKGRDRCLFCNEYESTYLPGHAIVRNIAGYEKHIKNPAFVRCECTDYVEYLYRLREIFGR